MKLNIPPPTALGQLVCLANYPMAGFIFTGLGAGAAPGDSVRFEQLIPNDYPMKLEPNLVRWVLPGWYFNALSSQAVVANTIYYIPIFVEKDTTYIRIGCEVTALVAGNADLRIFNFENGLPTSLVLSAGTVDTGTTGNKEITIAQALTRGYYFLAIRCSGAPSFDCPDLLRPIKPPIAGLSISKSFAQDQVTMSVAAAYADPAPAPTDTKDAKFAIVKLREN